MNGLKPGDRVVVKDSVFLPVDVPGDVMHVHIHPCHPMYGGYDINATTGMFHALGYQLSKVKK